MSYTILSRRAKSKTWKTMTTIEAPSAPKALRAYGCNVKGKARTVKTRRGSTIKAVPATA
jgi:hypothetical protein